MVVVFAVFIVVLLFAGWFLDRSSAHPSELYLSFVLTATSYLVLLLALFLSSLSLPADIKNKTLHTVVTKPVRSSEVILGRMVGFSVMGSLLLLVMGAISYGFVVRGLSHGHDVPPAELQRAEKAWQSGGPEQRPAHGAEASHHQDPRPSARHRDRPRPALPAASMRRKPLRRTGVVRTSIEQDHWHEVAYEITDDGGKPKITCTVGRPKAN